MEDRETIHQQLGRLEGRVDGLTATVAMTNERLTRFEDALHGDIKGLRKDVQDLVSKQGKDDGAHIAKRNQTTTTLGIVAVVISGMGILAAFLWGQP